MKFFLISIFLTLSVVVAADKRRCRSSEDCEADECCLSKLLIYLVRGSCEKLAKEGEECNEVDGYLKILGKKYFKKCPCAADLACLPREEIFIPIIGNKKVDMRCRPAEDSTTDEESREDTTGEEKTDSSTTSEEDTD